MGKALSHFFGITRQALRLTGDILVFIIGYQMLHGKGSSLHDPENKTPGDIAISSLAVPLMAGPGTIATTMSFSASGGWSEIVITISVFAFLCVVTFASYLFGERVLSVFGKTGLDIVTRLMGLILSVIGAQMFIEGVYGAIKAFS